ncbi:MAG: type II toxin-antitoxin system Phd/YefM family antitoxin [Actinomycetota bacterium]|nr:type II toxin-antitoxin system Phd/YefM family antitoxin [Actinomycetota bacterium]
MTTIPLAEVRANLSRLVDEAVRTHQRVEVTRKGRRAAVLLSAEDFDSIMETLDILSEADDVRAITQAQAQLRAGEGHSRVEVEEAMRAAGRL